MSENVLIKSEKYVLKSIMAIFLILGIIAGTILFFTLNDYWLKEYDHACETYSRHENGKDCGSWWDNDDDGICNDCEGIIEHPTKLGYFFAKSIEHLDFELFWWDAAPFIALLGFTLIGVLIYFALRSYELTVTEKRVYGMVAWGKRVDLPVDLISATSTISLFKGLGISTSSGQIRFLFIKNSEKIYEIINDLIIKRQQENNKSAETVMANSDEVDKLKKFKDLLDSGVITQEEFDAKKKQLLGL